MNLKTKIVMGIFIIGIVLIGGWWIWKFGIYGTTKPIVPPLKMKICSQDSDCIIVKGDCCGCSSGGTATTINKNFEEEWYEKLPKDCICLMVISDHPSCFKETRCINNRCVLRSKEEEQQVTITTDKTEYEQGETVKIIVRNNLDKSIWDFTSCGDKPFWSLQKLKDEVWTEIDFTLPSGEETCELIACERRESKELKPNSVIHYEWNLTSICEWPKAINEFFKVEPKPIEKGIYRVYLTYGVNKEFHFFEGETVYSNEFTIKEKSVIDPRCSEKVRGIGNCEAEEVGYEFNQGKGICVRESASGCSFEIPFWSLEECREVCEKKETDDTYKIYLKSRQFIPEQGISDTLKSAIATMSPEQMHVLLQFYHIPGNDERSKLSNLNVTLCGYIHNNAYFASVPAGYLTEICNLSFVRWIGEILPDDKISPIIRESRIPPEDINPDGTVNLSIMFFKDVSLDDASQIISDYGGIVKGRAPITNALVVIVPKESISTIANEDSVHWIDIVPGPPITEEESG